MYKRLFLCLVVTLTLLFSCKDKIDESNIYTFKGMTIASYIQSQPNLSMFAKLLERGSNSATHLETSMMALLGTVGNYVVFAPGNDALTLYLDSVYGKGKYDIDTFSTALANEIVLNSVIDMGKKEAPSEMNFYDGVFEMPAMNNAFMIFQYGDWGDGSVLKINYRSRIIKPDLKVDNGYVHIVDRVVEKGPATLSGLIGITPNLKIFSLLLRKTSWADSLVGYEDNDYRNSTYYDLQSTILDEDLLNEYPDHRYSSYTAFVETDEVFQKDWGIPAPAVNDSTGGLDNEDEIMAAVSARCASVYTQAKSKDLTSNQNAVNQFVSYHLIPYKLKYLSLVTRNGGVGYKWYLYYLNNTLNQIPDTVYYPDGTYILQKMNKPVDSESYYQSMGKPNRLFKIWLKGGSDERRINRHSYHDNSVFGDYRETSCDHEGLLIYEDNGSNPIQAVNGFYYPIDHVLVYDDYVKYTVLNTRIRYDFGNNCPEMIMDAGKGAVRYKENINVNSSSQEKGRVKLTTNQKTLFPTNYCKDILTKGTYSIGTLNQLQNILVFPSGEVTFKLHPVPFAGNWEIRLASCYGKVQFYLGENTTQINQMKDLGQRDFLWENSFTLPQEKEFLANNICGFEALNDSLTIYEHDKQCRTHGVMKMPYSSGGYLSFNVYRDPFTRQTCLSYISQRNMEDYFEHVIKKTPISTEQKCIYNTSRIIVYRGYLEPDKDYYLRLENKLENNQLNNSWFSGMLVELVPESVYDNPNRPEDIW